MEISTGNRAPIAANNAPRKNNSVTPLTSVITTMIHSRLLARAEDIFGEVCQRRDRPDDDGAEHEDPRQSQPDGDGGNDRAAQRTAGQDVAEMQRSGREAAHRPSRGQPNVSG